MENMGNATQTVNRIKLGILDLWVSTVPQSHPDHTQIHTDTQIFDLNSLKHLYQGKITQLSLIHSSTYMVPTVHAHKTHMSMNTSCDVHTLNTTALVFNKPFVRVPKQSYFSCLEHQITGYRKLLSTTANQTLQYGSVKDFIVCYFSLWQGNYLKYQWLHRKFCSWNVLSQSLWHPRTHSELYMSWNSTDMTFEMQLWKSRLNLQGCVNSHVQ